MSINQRLRRRRERGSASLEMVILMPVLFLVLFTGVQGALFYHARSLAIAAADSGAAAAAREHGTASAGVAAASQFVKDVAGDSLSQVAVSGTRTATIATVTVRGTSLTVIPGWTLKVTHTATHRVERIT